MQARGLLTVAVSSGPSKEARLARVWLYSNPLLMNNFFYNKTKQFTLFEHCISEGERMFIEVEVVLSVALLASFICGLFLVSEYLLCHP